MPVELYEARARVLKALAHPVRLQMVEALQRQPRCVCELQALSGLSLPTVSRHLSQLTEAGVLTSERLANRVVYSLRLRCLLDILPCVDLALEAPEACFSQAEAKERL